MVKKIEKMLKKILDRQESVIYCEIAFTINTVLISLT